MKYDLKELETWQKIGIACLLIVIPGIVGWLVEFFFAYYDHGMNQFYLKGGNFLPWINMYSVGTFLLLFCTYKFRHKPILVFIISILAAGIFEYITGFILYRGFGVRYWDYENEILNIHGYVCLISLCGFGIGGLFINYMLIPGLIKLSKKIPKKVFLTISITLCSIILMDEIYNFLITRLFNLPTAIDIYMDMGFKYL